MSPRLALGAGMLAAMLVVVVVAANVFASELSGLFIRFPGLDKVFHIVGSALLMMVIHALGRRIVSNERLAATAAFGVSAALMAADEVLQGLVPGRSVEALDLLAGGAGLTLGWVLSSRPPAKIATIATLAGVLVGAFAVQHTYAQLIDYSRALRFERNQDFVQARTYYLRALESGLRSPELFNELGWVEIESGIGDPRKAVEYASRALREQPSNPDVLDTYGWALHHAGRSNEALPYLQRAYAAKPEMFCIHYHLGEVYRALRQVDKAAEHYRKQVLLSETREAARAAERLKAILGGAAVPGETR